MGLRLSKILKQFCKKGHRSYLQSELCQAGLAVWWWISETALHPLSCKEVEWALASAKNGHQEAFQSWHNGLWPYPWEQTPHQLHSHIWHRWVTARLQCPAACWSHLSSQIIPVGFWYSKMHQYSGSAQRRDPLLPALVWYFQVREELCWHAGAGSGAAREKLGKIRAVQQSSELLRVSVRADSLLETIPNTAAWRVCSRRANFSWANSLILVINNMCFRQSPRVQIWSPG